MSRLARRTFALGAGLAVQLGGLDAGVGFRAARGGSIGQTLGPGLRNALRLGRLGRVGLGGRCSVRRGAG